MVDDGDATVQDKPARSRPSEKRLAAERYRLIEPLGRGGMGEVFVAHDEQLARDVAIKRMLEPAPSSAQVDRFLREAKIQGRLDHPSIPPVYELSRDTDGRPFFAMKLLKGTTLSAILKAEESAQHSTQHLLRAFVEVCHAVELAHTRGVIHRDLKPANVMLGELGEVYVLDWGVAKIVGVREIESLRDFTSPAEFSTMPGVAVGTRRYMAPEQLRGDAIDHRVDVYALGCVLFEILARTPLHPDERRQGTFDARPSAHAPGRDVPPELDELCVGAAEADRDKRIQTARQLADSVQAFLDGDRDLATRRELARKHLVTARALVEGEGEHQRRDAMVAAGRALALDPTLEGPAELVTRLMLEPPRGPTPHAVEESLRADGIEQARRLVGVGLVGYASYTLFALSLLALDVADPRYAIAMVGLAVLNIAISMISMRRVDSPWRMGAVIGGNALLVLLCSRMFSPFLIAPAVAAVTLMAILGNPLLHTDRIIVIVGSLITAAMLAPLAAEYAGVMSSTFETGHLSILMAAPGLVGGPTNTVYLIVFAVSLVATAAIMARARARSEGDARRRLHMQAWWLRQLVDPR